MHMRNSIRIPLATMLAFAGLLIPAAAVNAASASPTATVAADPTTATPKGGTGTQSHADKECLEVLEKGGSMGDAGCDKAPSVIMPAANELFWGGLAFVVLFAALAKFAFPGIKKGMEGRSEKIRADLAQAETAKADATGVLEDYQRQLADARAESARIIEEARATADAMRRDLQTKAEADIAELRQRAAADVEAAKVQAVADLRGEVTALAIGAAEHVVQQNLNDATNAALVDQFIAQVGAGR